MNQRCGYCYSYGHTKMGCPCAKKNVDDHMEEYKAAKAENPEASIYEIRRKYEWSWSIVNAFELYEKKKARATKPRQCKFCFKGGHNKRTCPELKRVNSYVRDANVGYREALYEYLKANGVGLGTLLTRTHFSKWSNTTKSWMEGRDVVGVITHIHWPAINIASDSAPLALNYLWLKSVKIYYPSLNTSEIISMPLLNTDTEHPYKGACVPNRHFTLLAPAPVLPPDEWFNGSDIAGKIEQALKHKEETGHQWLDDSDSYKQKLLLKWSKAFKEDSNA